MMAELTGLDQAATELFRQGKLEQFVSAFNRAGGCEHPVVLRGRSDRFSATDGALVNSFDSSDLPGGVLRVPCKNRRASRCRSCSRVYRFDAFQLITAGIVGGLKGVEASVGQNPLWFVTVTAPSFGSVVDGVPADSATYKYQEQVVWNYFSGRLFSLVKNQVYRELAGLAGESEAECKQELRIEYVKVAEFQKRGAVHFHCLIRFDGVDVNSRTTQYSGRWSDYTQKRAIRQAIRHVSINAPGVGDERYSQVLRFGRQVDVRAVRGFAPEALDHRLVAAYLAKYSTKGSDDVDLDNASDELQVHFEKLREVARRVWWESRESSGSDSPYAMMRKWANSFGFRGHFMTKSRVYSTTFLALRSARSAFVRRQTAEWDSSLMSPPDGDDESETVVVNWFQYVKSGWGSSEESALASAAAGAAREWRINKMQAADGNWRREESHGRKK